MTKELYLRENNALFSEWKQKYLGHRFVEDGIVDPDTWFSAEESKTPKIAFVLKEANNMNEPLGPWLLKQEVDKKRHAIWNRTAEWADSLLRLSECPNQLPPYHSLTLAETTARLRQVAIVNIKKSDGVETSDYDNLREYATGKRGEDAGFLSRQIALIDPDIIVCGYTFSLAKEAFGLKVERNKNRCDAGTHDDIGIYQVHLGHPGEAQPCHSHSTYIIDYYHPANRYPASLSYYGLAAIYQQMLLNRSKLTHMSECAVSQEN